MRVLALAIALAVLPGPASAAEEDTRRLTIEICAAGNVAAMTTLAAAAEEEGRLQPRQIADVFGTSDYLADRGFCQERQAVSDAFAAFIEGRPDAGALEKAFSRARLLAHPPRGLSSARRGKFEGSFLGLAGPQYPVVPH